MPERDPRITPAVGDVLRLPYGRCEVTAVGKRVTFSLTNPAGSSVMDRIPMNCTTALKKWPEEMKNAFVEGVA